MHSFKFKARGFTTLLTAFSFIISLISGIILYFTPQGRVAHWTNWSIWGLDKETWGALHINSSLVFFIFIFVHLYFNWKPLVYYIKKKAAKTINLKLELFLVSLISVFIVVASIHDLEPFNSIIKWNNNVKNYWATKADAEPPIPHAEELTVTEFCTQTNIPLEKFKRIATSQNWIIRNNDQKISDIAVQNKISPADIYQKLQATASAQGKAGWGRKTLQQTCDEFGIDINTAISRLKADNLQAIESHTIRDLANKLGMSPVKVVSIITDRAVKANH